MARRKDVNCCLNALLLLSGGGCTSCNGLVSDAQERLGELATKQKKYGNGENNTNSYR